MINNFYKSIFILVFAFTLLVQNSFWAKTIDNVKVNIPAIESHLNQDCLLQHYLKVLKKIMNKI